MLKRILASPVQSGRSPGISVGQYRKTQQNKICFTLFFIIDWQFNHLSLQSWSILPFSVFFETQQRSTHFSNCRWSPSKLQPSADDWVDFPPAWFHIKPCLWNLTQRCASLCLHQVALLGLDLLSALVTRLQERFRAHIGTGETLSRISAATGALVMWLVELRVCQWPSLSPHYIIACLFCT